VRTCTQGNSAPAALRLVTTRLCANWVASARTAASGTAAGAGAADGDGDAALIARASLVCMRVS
jgi:hypothetical protein